MFLIYFAHRSALFFGIVFLIPCACLEFLAVVVYLLPERSGERVGLSVTIVLGVTVFLLILGDVLPAVARPSILGWFKENKIHARWFIVVR